MVQETPASAAYLTVRQAATQLGVSVGMVYKLFQTGQLQGLKIGKAVRISRASFDNLLAAAQTKPPEQPVPIQAVPESPSPPQKARRARQPRQPS